MRVEREDKIDRRMRLAGITGPLLKLDVTLMWQHNWNRCSQAIDFEKSNRTSNTTLKLDHCGDSFINYVSGHVNPVYVIYVCLLTFWSHLLHLR